jgi:hypothetical protein
MKTIHGFHPPGRKTIKNAPGVFVEHGAYVQDVRYAESAGATFGDAATVKIDTCSEFP